MHRWGLLASKFHLRVSRNGTASLWRVPTPRAHAKRALLLGSNIHVHTHQPSWFSAENSWRSFRLFRLCEILPGYTGHGQFCTKMAWRKERGTLAVHETWTCVGPKSSRLAAPSLPTPIPHLDPWLTSPSFTGPAVSRLPGTLCSLHCSPSSGLHSCVSSSSAHHFQKIRWHILSPSGVSTHSLFIVGLLSVFYSFTVIFTEHQKEEEGSACIRYLIGSQFTIKEHKP